MTDGKGAARTRRPLTVCPAGRLFPNRLNHSTARELRAYGSRSSLFTRDGRRAIASAQGNYAGFYTEFARPVRGEEPEPVPATEGIRTLAVVEAARRSALENAAIAL